MKKFLLILIAWIGISFYLSAQSAGDYTSVGSGNWNDPTKWILFDGANWVGTTTYPGQNPGTGDVTISAFDEMRLTASVPHPVSNLWIEYYFDEYRSRYCKGSINSIITDGKRKWFITLFSNPGVHI